MHTKVLPESTSSHVATAAGTISFHMPFWGAALRNMVRASVSRVPSTIYRPAKYEASPLHFSTNSFTYHVILLEVAIDEAL
jgi:hypothetical protein